MVTVQITLLTTTPMSSPYLNALVACNMGMQAAKNFAPTKSSRSSLEVPDTAR